MTIPIENAPDDGSRAGVPAPVPEQPDIERFVGAGADGSAAPRGIRTRLLDYSAHAAMIVGLIGFAWTVGGHVVHRPILADAPPKVAAAVPRATTTDAMAELRSRNRELADALKSMQAKLDLLQTSAEGHAKVAAEVHNLQASVHSLEIGLGSAHSEQAAAAARLDGKIDKLAHEPGSKLQQLVDRLGKLEHASVDLAPTSSMPRAVETATKPADTVSAAPSPRPLPRPAELKAEPRGDGRIADRGVDAKIPVDADANKPPVLASWVVRGVYGGVALIEGRRGTLEVVPGVSIPGAGVVKSIDRHGSGWTVTTTKGLVAYAAPARDYRRADRGSYSYGAPDYGYDF